MMMHPPAVWLLVNERSEESPLSVDSVLGGQKFLATVRSLPTNDIVVGLFFFEHTCKCLSPSDLDGRGSTQKAMGVPCSNPRSAFGNMGDRADKGGREEEGCEGASVDTSIDLNMGNGTRSVEYPPHTPFSHGGSQNTTKAGLEILHLQQHHPR